MLIINILTQKNENQNTISFLHPLLRHRKKFLDRQICLQFFTLIEPQIFECDILIVSNKWRDKLGHWKNDITALCSTAKEKGIKVIYADRSSTPGSIDRFALDICDVYTKPTFFTDLSLYDTDIHSNRLFSEHIKREFNVVDNRCVYEKPIRGPLLAAKLRPSWSVGLGNFSLLSLIFSHRVPFPFLETMSHMRYEKLTSVYSSRKLEVSCRMNIRYSQATIEFHRRMCQKKISGYCETERVRIFRYKNELKNAQIVISPFGTSEINYKDFEVASAGSCLVKPSISHIQTWPPLFEENVTYTPCNWNFDDLTEVVRSLLADRDRRIYLADQLQNRYKKYVYDETSFEYFFDLFIRTIK